MKTLNQESANSINISVRDMAQFIRDRKAVAEVREDQKQARKDEQKKGRFLFTDEENVKQYNRMMLVMKPSSNIYGRKICLIKANDPSDPETITVQSRRQARKLRKQKGWSDTHKIKVLSQEKW